MANKRGVFITLEGGEGSGKSTQIKRLTQCLEEAGHDVLLTREPGGSDAGEAMRDLFVAQNGAEWPVAAQALLMFAARAHHTETLIKPALSAGRVVISDRYTDSTRVYQGVAGGMPKEAIESIKQSAIGDFEPDITFLLDIAPEEGLARGQGRGNDTDTTFETKTIAFHEMLRQGYLDIAHADKERCIVIDAAQDMDTIADQLKQATLEKIEKYV
jgi:dTMP kinase